MADPILVACAKDAWTKVATNVTAGQIWKQTANVRVYLQTYRATGGAAPTDKTKAQPIAGQSILIDSPTGIDVYIQPVGEAADVRVDL